MEEKEKRGSGLLAYITLALMTTAIVVCLLTMVILRNTSSLWLALGTIPVLLIMALLGHRVDLSMSAYLPKRILDGLVRLVLWLVAVLVLWMRQNHGGLTVDFVMLLLVIVQALTLLLRVIHALGGMKTAALAAAPKEEPAPEEEPAEEEKPAEAPAETEDK